MTNETKSHPYVKSGRDVGRITETKEFQIYIAGSSYDSTPLTSLEYYLWQQINCHDSIESWREAMVNKFEVPKNVVENVEIKLKENNLILEWHFADFEDNNLMNFRAIRNGFSHGYVNGEWLIFSSERSKPITLSKEEFYVWRGATGDGCFIDVIDSIMTGLQIDEHEAFRLFFQYGFNFIRSEMWSLDYLNLSEGNE